MADEPPVPQAQHDANALGLPEDVLDLVLSCSDLRTRNLAVTTSKAFCASYARLSSTLDYQLVFKRFPLAEVSTRGVAERPAPPELFRTYSRYFGQSPELYAPVPQLTAPLDSYTLAVELELINTATNESETLFVGTGTAEILRRENVTPVYNFSVPPGLFFTAFDRCGSRWEDSPHIGAKIVATRRFNGSLQHARLYFTRRAEAWGADRDTAWRAETRVVDELRFGPYDLTMQHCHSTRSAALRWYVKATELHAFLDLDWEADGAHDEHTSNPSTLKAHFMWNGPSGEDIAMSLADVRYMLEHYLDWA